MKHIIILSLAILLAGCSTVIEGLSVNPTTGTLTIQRYTSTRDLELSHTKSGSNQTWSVSANASSPTRAFFDGAAKLVETGAKLKP